MRKPQIRFAVVAAIVGWSACARAQESQLHVYHIGNSLTRSITMDRLHLLFAGQGIDYQALWERTYPFDQTTERPTGDEFQSRNYFRKLIDRLNEEFAEKLEMPIRMIPVGEVWYACDKRIKAGELPGLSELYMRNPRLVPGWKPAVGLSAGVNIFYADGIHPNPIPHLDGNVANYVNGLTICSVISGKSPLGLPGSIYSLDDQQDAALIKSLQETVWQVVAAHTHTGIRK